MDPSDCTTIPYIIRINFRQSPTDWHGRGPRVFLEHFVRSSKHELDGYISGIFKRTRIHGPPSTDNVCCSSKPYSAAAIPAARCRLELVQYPTSTIDASLPGYQCCCDGGTGIDDRVEHGSRVAISHARVWHRGRRWFRPNGRSFFWA